MKESEIRSLCKEGKFSGKQINGILEETHISWVILTSTHVFKIKKAVRLSFVDFSTLTKRRHFCKREVVLNSRFSDIYLGVLPVRYGHGEWSLGEGQGRVVEYAVVMKRMNSARRMDLMLQAGKIDQATVRHLARVVATFHKQADTIRKPFRLKFARESFNDIKSIRSLVAESLGKEYAMILSASITWNKMFLRQYGYRFRERVGAGYRRDVHGDLHSRNIFILDKPVVFDCIEFNDEYRQIDLIDEIAFLCMDLESWGKQKLATAFKEEYTTRLPCFHGDDDEMIFFYYKCYRANVRAKVQGLAAKQEGDPEVKLVLLSEVKKYLKLVEGYMRNGLMG